MKEGSHFPYELLLAGQLLAVSCIIYLVVLYPSVNAITDPNDREALLRVKASINAATIDATSCVGSWDFLVDPCEHRFQEQFTCGIDCTNVADASRNVSRVRAGAVVYQRVTSLQLDNAGYEGSLSPWVGNLSALQILRISGNSFTGGIPYTVGKLQHLAVLDLSFNNLSGVIPRTIAALTHLQILNLAHNNISGQLPPFLNKLSSLTELRLESNQLHGAFPDVRNLAVLEMLDASNNMLSGPFPRELPPSLCSICLRNNALTGKLPKTIANLTDLNVLDLSNNQLTGGISDALLVHPSLEQLNLSLNKLDEITVHSKSIGQSRLVALDLGYNQFSGSLPSFFTLMRQLSSLSLRYNFFHGVIPQSYGMKVVTNAMDTKPLERLLLDGNYLTGPLPTPFMNLASDHTMAASFADNCFENCPRKLTFCQGKDQKAETLCRLFNSPS